MCTVTFIPLNNSDFVLTSNRDESPNRISLAPEIYEVNSVKTLFPKDKIAGGSWIGVSEINRVLCILNGAFDLHERKEHYETSRGVVVRDLLITKNIDDAIDTYRLDGVEPFTLVIVDWNESLKLIELVWDGVNKHVTNLPLKAQIWSSSTLYTKEMKEERKSWFNDFIASQENNSRNVLQFHNRYDKDNLDYGVIMDRHFVKTTSITQIEKSNTNVSMQFNDLKTDTVSLKSIDMLHSIHE